MNTRSKNNQNLAIPTSKGIDEQALNTPPPDTPQIDQNGSEQPSTSKQALENTENKSKSAITVESRVNNSSTIFINTSMAEK